MLLKILTTSFLSTKTKKFKKNISQINQLNEKQQIEIIYELFNKLIRYEKIYNKNLKNNTKEKNEYKKLKQKYIVFLLKNIQANILIKTIFFYINKEINEIKKVIKNKYSFNKSNFFILNSISEENITFILKTFNERYIHYFSSINTEKILYYYIKNKFKKIKLYTTKFENIIKLYQSNNLLTNKLRFKLFLYFYKQKNLNKKEKDHILFLLLKNLKNREYFLKIFNILKYDYIFENKKTLLDIICINFPNLTFLKFFIENDKEKKIIYLKYNFNSYFWEFYKKNILYKNDILKYFIDNKIFKDTELIKTIEYYYVYRNIDNNLFRYYNFLIKYKNYILSIKEIKVLILTLLNNLGSISLKDEYTSVNNNIELLYFLTIKYRKTIKDIKFKEEEIGLLFGLLLYYSLGLNFLKHFYKNKEIYNITKKNRYKLKRIIFFYFKNFINDFEITNKNKIILIDKIDLLRTIYNIKVKNLLIFLLNKYINNLNNSKKKVYKLKIIKQLTTFLKINVH